MEATFRMMGWDSDSAQSSSSPHLREEFDWMKEKSREELEELLGKADDLIKEREHGLCSFDDMMWLMTYPFFLQNSILT